MLARESALSLKDLAVSGRDLIDAGIAPGKTMGRILDELLEAVLDDPDLNERGALLALAKNLDERRGPA